MSATVAAGKAEGETMTDKQLAVLLREFTGRIRNEIETAIGQLPDEAKIVRKFALTNHEYTEVPALDGFQQFAKDLAATAEMLERDNGR